jgi:hypothetical protein
MKYLKHVMLVITALAALVGANSASATTLEVGGVTQNKSVGMVMTLRSGTSTILKDTSGFSANTCTTSELSGSTASPFSGATVTEAVSAWVFNNCSSPVTVHKNGTLHFAYTSGTNGMVSSSGAEWTVDGPFGYLPCVTGNGTTLGALTGSKEGHATMDWNAVINCGISARWTATYTVTSPTGLGVSA